MAKTAWIFSYKIKKNVTDEGFISWEHYVQENTWTDFVLWESEEDANNATTVGQGHKVTEDFYACIQMNTCRALISHLVKKY